MGHIGVSKRTPNGSPWEMRCEIDSVGRFLYHSWQLFCYGKTRKDLTTGYSPQILPDHRCSCNRVSTPVDWLLALVDSEITLDKDVTVWVVVGNSLAQGADSGDKTWAKNFLISRMTESSTESSNHAPRSLLSLPIIPRIGPPIYLRLTGPQLPKVYFLVG